MRAFWTTIHATGVVYHSTYSGDRHRQRRRARLAADLVARGPAMSKITKLQVNGNTHAIDADETASLLGVLRDQLNLTGSKYGCGEGQCGACTVLVDGYSRRSCITKLGTVADKKITTIEGLAAGDRLHPVQQAFLDEAAMQCAYCTSGMIMSAVALLRKTPHPSRGEITDFMEGNVCRCGTHPRIVAAIERAAKAMPEPAKESRP